MTGQRGLFISIDGPGGSGKSTVAALVIARLCQPRAAMIVTHRILALHADC